MYLCRITVVSDNLLTATGCMLLENLSYDFPNFSFQGKLFSDSESIQARAEAAVLLKQLDFPVCTVLLFKFAI